jgi:hypothetical protein
MYVRSSWSTYGRSATSIVNVGDRTPDDSTKYSVRSATPSRRTSKPGVSMPCSMLRRE